MPRCPGWCGECYENATGRANHAGHFHYRRYTLKWAWELILALRKPASRPAEGGAQMQIGSGSLLDIYPDLREFLTCPKWADGSSRALGSLTVFCDDGRLKACVNDKECNRVLFVSAESLEGLLEAIDSQIGNDGADWRAVRTDARKRPQK